MAGKNVTDATKQELENLGERLRKLDLEVPQIAKDQYHAFISHSMSTPEDVDYAEKISDTLENAGFACLMPERDFIPGHTLMSSIEGGIKNSERVIMLLSKAFLKSDYHVLESEGALQRTYGSNTRIFVPILLPGMTIDDVPGYIKDRTVCLQYTEDNFWDKLLKAIIYDVTVTAALPAGNVAYGLAWSYFYGYLNLVLPGLKERVESSELYNSPEGKGKFLYKMMIFLPESCYCPPKLIDEDKDHFSHATHIPFNATRAGNINRDYKSSVYKVKDPDSNEEFFFIAELATPLLSLYEMHEGMIAGLTEQQKFVQMKSFAGKLEEILEHVNNTKCHGHYVLVHYKDKLTPIKEGEGRRDSFTQIVVKKLRHELEKLNKKS